MKLFSDPSKGYSVLLVEGRKLVVEVDLDSLTEAPCGHLALNVSFGCMTDVRRHARTGTNLAWKRAYQKRVKWENPTHCLQAVFKEACALASRLVRAEDDRKVTALTLTGSTESRARLYTRLARKIGLWVTREEEEITIVIPDDLLW